MGDRDKPIIVKQHSESVDSKFALFSWGITTARVSKGYVTSPISYRKGKYYISVSLSLRGGDIISIGSEIETKYRIQDSGSYKRSTLRDYRLKRLDDAPMTNLDITNSKKGEKVTLLNTSSSEDIYNLIAKL